MERNKIEQAIQTVKRSEVICLNGYKQFDESILILVKLAEKVLMGNVEELIEE